MERHNWRPIYVHGMSLDGSYLCDATHAQLQLFYNLPPDAQKKVSYDDFSSDNVHDSYNYRCKPSSGRCVLRSCLHGFFMA